MKEDLNQFYEKLDRLRTECAEPAWDGYTAMPITTALIEKTKARTPGILERFRSVGVPAEKVHAVPTPQASVQFEAEHSTGADEGIYMARTTFIRAIEELSELIATLSHNYTGFEEDELDGLAEDIAEVRIMLDKIEQMYEEHILHAHVSDIMDAKRSGEPSSCGHPDCGDDHGGDE